MEKGREVIETGGRLNGCPNGKGRCAFYLFKCLDAVLSGLLLINIINNKSQILCFFLFFFFLFLFICT